MRSTLRIVNYECTFDIKNHVTTNTNVTVFEDRLVKNKIVFYYPKSRTF